MNTFSEILRTSRVNNGQEFKGLPKSRTYQAKLVLKDGTIASELANDLRHRVSSEFDLLNGLKKPIRPSNHASLEGSIILQGILIVGRSKVRDSKELHVNVPNHHVHETCTGNSR